jgi:hypothetical protein
MKLKCDMKYKWRNEYNIKFTDEEFEFIYGVYINCSECMLCNKTFEGSFDRCLDHDHKTGEIRYILCRSCNTGYDRKNNKLGLSNMCEIKMGNNKYWVLYKKIDGTTKRHYFNTKKYSIEQVVKIRNNLFNTLD